MSRLGRESGLGALLVWHPSSFLSVNFILTAGCAGVWSRGWLLHVLFRVEFLAFCLSAG